jgi:hypothetical protein
MQRRGSSVRRPSSRRRGGSVRRQIEEAGEWGGGERSISESVEEVRMGKELSGPLVGAPSK